MTDDDDPETIDEALVPQPHGGALLRGGKKGNRGGVGKLNAELRDMLRTDARRALSFLWELASDPEQPGTVRVKAIEVMLDHSIGKLGTQHHSLDPDALVDLSPLVIITTPSAAEMEAHDKAHGRVGRGPLPLPREESKVEVGKVEVEQEFPDGSAIIAGPLNDAEGVEFEVEDEPPHVSQETSAPRARLDDEPVKARPRSRYFYSSTGVRKLNARPTGSYTGMGLPGEKR
jgi:hypothetical protein